MTQSSVAVANGDGDWLLLNASPDLRSQLAANPALYPRGLRGSPIASVVITNADVDHIAGLLTLREKTPFRLFATAAVLKILHENSVFRVMDPSLVSEVEIALDQSFAPLDGVEVTAFAVPGKIALYLEGDQPPDTNAMGEQTIGLRITAAGKVFYYIPGCAALPDWLCAKLAEADLLMFDGTVFDDDDMPRLGLGSKTGARMGHLAMAGERGSLQRLEGIRARKIYTHINNTNPVLDPTSTAREAVRTAGWEIAQDGMEIRL